MIRKHVVAAALTFVVAASLLASSCKTSKKITGPNDPNPSTYSVVLRADDTLRYLVNNENIITVRVFNGQTVPAGVEIRWRTESNVGYIDDNNQTIFAQSDTNSFPCGSNPCLDYHCDDTTLAKDALFAYAVVGAETVATTSVGFFLKH